MANLSIRSTITRAKNARADSGTGAWCSSRKKNKVYIRNYAKERETRKRMKGGDNERVWKVESVEAVLVLLMSNRCLIEISIPDEGSMLLNYRQVTYYHHCTRPTLFCPSYSIQFVFDRSLSLSTVPSQMHVCIYISTNLDVLSMSNAR